jgi:hypothetical protein
MRRICPAGTVDARHGLDGHGVGDHVLDDVADRCQQGAEHIPGTERHDGTHGLGVTEQTDHDSQARGDEPGADKHQYRLEPPDQINQVPDRHLQRPGNVDPESQCGQERGGQAEVVLNEKGTDDTGESRYAVGEIHHQWRQVGQPKLPPQFQDDAIKPAVGCYKHGARGCRFMRPRTRQARLNVYQAGNIEQICI